MANPDSYLDATELAAVRAEIARTGFVRDPLVGKDADRAHIGLNLAVGWPLPAPVDAAYLELERRLSTLGPGAYVYPFSTTHVTVLTAVSFKQYPDPSPDSVAEVEHAAERLGEWLSEAVRDVPSFTLDFGPPALTPAAAFIPIRNPTGEIARIRARALDFCRQSAGIFSAASAPRRVHSTVLRFSDPPSDPLAFAQTFDAMATRPLGPATIDRILVTLESKPYMRAGRVTRAVELSRG